MIDVSELRPMNDDLILIHKPANEVKGGSIVLPGEDTETNTTMFFTVLKTGPQVDTVQVGDVVWVPWKKLVPPFILTVDGVEKNVTLTSEKEILAIIGE